MQLPQNQINDFFNKILLVTIHRPFTPDSCATVTKLQGIPSIHLSSVLKEIERDYCMPLNP